MYRLAWPPGTSRCLTMSTAVPIKTIRLATASAAYDILVGQNLLASLHPRLQKLAGGAPYRPFLITSPDIWKLWSARVRDSFPEAAHPTVLFLPPGEKQKRLSQIESLAEQLAHHGADRNSLLIAFGGGVLGDMTGFLAAMYMRGIPYIQVPTTFLAQVDSSVGGKTGVNLVAGKNLLGAFHHPRLVIADIDVLSTLSPRELRAGLQESVKASIIRDAKLFRALEQTNAEELSSDPSAIARVIAASIQVKAAIVETDEKESGVRMLLNFGHTVGHAIEAATGYQRLLHGEAVAWGSIAALHLALSRKTIDASTFARMANLILAYGPLPRFRASADELVRLTAGDKKARSGRRAFILPTAVGHAEVIHDVSDEELLDATQAMLTDVKRLTRTEAKA